MLDVYERAAALKRRLKHQRVIGAVRDGSLRLGFHAYNDESDVQAALDALGRP